MSGTKESNSTQNDFEFNKRVPITTIPEVVASFLLITLAFLQLQTLQMEALDKVQVGVDLIYNIILYPSLFSFSLFNNTIFRIFNCFIAFVGN